MSDYSTAAVATLDVLAPHESEGKPHLARTDRPLVRTSALTTANVAPVVAAAAGSLAVTWLGYERVLPFSGVLGFWVLWYLGFLALLFLQVAATESVYLAKDRLAAALVTTAGVVLVAGLAGVVAYTAIRGWQAVVNVNFFTETMAFARPDDPLTSGGVLHAMVATLEQIAIAMIVTVPLGILTALYLNEVDGRLARFVRSVVDAMTAIPTIVAGLFIFAVVILTFGFNRSGLAAALALSVEMLPVVTRTAELVLRLVPNGLREASYALGASQLATVRRVVLPTARAGLVTAVLLGVARVVGETSPVLLTAGFTNELNVDPLHGPQTSLPLFVFNYVRYPIDGAIARAYGAALVLLAVVLVFFTVARIVGGKEPGRMSRRARRKFASQMADSSGALT